MCNMWELIFLIDQLVYSEITEIFSEVSQMHCIIHLFISCMKLNGLCRYFRLKKEINIYDIFAYVKFGCVSFNRRLAN